MKDLLIFSPPIRLRLMIVLVFTGAIWIEDGLKALAGNSGQGNTPPVPISQPPLQQISVENVLSGQVVKVIPGGIFIKNSGSHNYTLLHLLPTTSIWDGLWVKSIPLAVGDRIDASVTRRPDKSFDVQKMWVNLVNLVGNVSKVEKRSDGLLLNLENQFIGSVIVSIDLRTQVSWQGKDVAFGKNPLELPEGKWVRIIGRRLRNGVVLATRLGFE